MNQVRKDKVNLWLQRISIALLIAAGMIYFAAIPLAGGSIFRCVWYGIVFCLIFLPGVRVTELLLPQLTRAEKTVMSFSLGLGVLFLAYISFGRLTALPLWGMLIPLLPLTVWQLWIWAESLRESKPRIQWKMRPEWSLLLLAFAGALFIFTFQGVLSFSKASMAGNMVYPQDMLWRTANAGAVQLGSPFMDIQLYGSQLSYHYLGDAISGFGAMFSGVLPYEATCFYTYPFLLLFLVVGLYAAARTYGASEKQAAVMPFAVLFLNGWRSRIALDIMLDMNGLATATGLTCAVLIYIFRAEKDETVSPRFYVAFALSTLTLLMSKNLYSMLLTCALLASVVFGLVFQHCFYRRGLLMAGIGGGFFALCWHFVYQFAQKNLILSVWQTPKDLCLDVLRSLPLGAVLWLISVVCSAIHRQELSFGRLVVNAAAIGGLMAYYIYYHYAASQAYFLLASLLFMWFCALDIEPLLKKCKPLRWGAGVLACACLAATVITLAPYGYNGFEAARHTLGVRPEYPRGPQTVTAADEETAMWLRENLKPDEMFATNRNARDPYYAKEGIWHYLTAMSGRQAYVEGWLYGLTYGHDYDEMRRQLEQVNDVMFACEDAETAFAMAQQEGIDYLVVTKWLRPAPFVGAEPVFETEDTAIYKVPEA